MGEKHVLNNKNILEVKNLNIVYDDDKQAIKNLSISIIPNCVVAVIGPIYAGKSSLLRSINRLNDLYKNIKTHGDIYFKGKNINDYNPFELRKKIGMVFNEPHVFPYMSIYENVISGYNLNQITLPKQEKDEIVENALKDVSLWEDLKDELNKKPDFLSKGEQQRLCIARTIALKPEIILMDEPTASMSVYCANRIENMIYKYKENHTLIITTSNVSQAARTSDYTMFIDNGELIEYGATTQLFWNPMDKRTEKFITNQN